jgi:signal transduction histidine kinase
LKGITGRLVLSYFLIIFLTVAVLEIFLITALNKYYYSNMQNLISNQITAAADFYNNYFSSSSLEKNVQDNADIFWKNTNAEVQIINKNNKLLMDSIGYFTGETIDDSDVAKALQGTLGVYIANDENKTDKMMYVSYPLKSMGQIEGVLRFAVSLSDVDNTIKRITNIFLLIGALVSIISGMVGILLSNSIVKPIKEVTVAAKKIASGRFNEKLNIQRKDEIGELSSTFNFMAEEILKNDRLKNEFIASVSHELRTPLTSIKGWAATIKSNSLDDKAVILDGLDIIEKESDRLTLLVEELLDFSRLISGKVNLTKDYIDITNNLRHIEKHFIPRASRQKIHFNVEIEENLPLLYADSNRIDQVIINVLDNAFKFTNENGVVDLSSYRKENNVIVRVADSGIGIPKEELPFVMDKFFKGKSALSKNGLGLSISKEIITLHHGKIEIFSEPGKGTEVTISLPVEDGELI